MIDILKSAASAVARRSRERAAIAALAALTDRDLRDMGLSRATIRGAVRHGRGRA